MSDLIRRLQRLNYSIHSNGYKDSAIFEAIDAIQQAHRAAEESAKDAHKRGWEQARGLAVRHLVAHGILHGADIVDKIEYKERQHE